MEVAEIKEILCQREQWAGCETEELCAGLLRVDLTAEQAVISMQLAERSAGSCLQLGDQLALELSAHLGRRIDVVCRKKTTTSDDRGPTRGASRPKQAPFGLKPEINAIPGVDKVICVASGKGGVGKSTVATNLALALRNRGLEVGLIDADLYGPSIPKMLGCENVTPEVVNGEMRPIEVYGLKAMSFASLNHGQAPLIWRGPMIAKALMQFFYQVDWGELDYLVIDLPPGTGDIQLTMIERLPLGGAVIVSSPQDLALIDAAKAVQMFRKLGVPILGLVENMSAFVCGNCGAEHEILGRGGARSYAEENNIPLLAEIPLDMGYRLAADRGEPPAAIAGHPLALHFANAARLVVQNESLQL